MKKALLLAISLLLLNTPVTMASTIIDTGPGPESAGGYTVASYQWLAGEFVLDQDYFITGLYGWIARHTSSNDNTSYNFTISIYGDGGEIPDTGNRIYSNSASVSGPDEIGKWAGYDITWIDPYGNTGQFLSSGTYWAAFEVRPPNYADPLSGYMPEPSETPLDNYAFKYDSGWYGNDTMNFGLRVLGTPAPTPEPATILLFGLGLLSLAGTNRKNK
jgi:hypothetical protein